MKYLNSIGKKFILIDSNILLYDPKKILSQWCDHIDLKFDNSMLKWNEGNHPQDGIWWKHWYDLSLIHIYEPTRLRRISYAVFCLKKKNLLGKISTKSIYVFIMSV